MLTAALPGDTYLEGWIGVEFLTPTFRERRLGGEVRHLGRHRGWARPEQPGQAQERCVHVERRRGHALGYDLIDALAPGQKAHEIRRTGQKHRGPLLLQEACIAHELHRVADALLGVEKDAPPGQRRAVPGGSRESWEFAVRFLPAPFVFAPALLPVSLEKQQQSTIEPRAWMVRRRLQRLLETGHGLGEAAL